MGVSSGGEQCLSFLLWCGPSCVWGVWEGLPAAAVPVLHAQPGAPSPLTGCGLHSGSGVQWGAGQQARATGFAPLLELALYLWLLFLWLSTVLASWPSPDTECGQGLSASPLPGQRGKPAL